MLNNDLICDGTSASKKKVVHSKFTFDTHNFHLKVTFKTASIYLNEGHDNLTLV